MSEDAAPGTSFSSPFDAPRDVCPRGQTCLLVDASHALLSGSSMSAPQVAGAAALLLERDPMLTEPEILMLLQQGARRPVGLVRADDQLGVGVLDVGGAMDALAARTGGSEAREPDARASWLSLSSGYLRTEPMYAVVGTVEVRALDGKAADGFEPSRLALVVGEGGVAAEPLSRVAPGLWRFKVTGAPVHGAQAVSLAVTLDGTVIGDAGAGLYGGRELPVGADRWIAFGSAQAFGGCGVTRGSPPRGELVGLACTSLWVAAWARRRQARLTAAGAAEPRRSARRA